MDEKTGTYSFNVRTWLISSHVLIKCGVNRGGARKRHLRELKNALIAVRAIKEPPICRYIRGRYLQSETESISLTP